MAQALGAESLGPLSIGETNLLIDLPRLSSEIVGEYRRQIESGYDPLGDSLCSLRSAKQRRKIGAIFTPLPVVRAMLDLAQLDGEPDRVIDPGAGSARFLVEAGRRFPTAELIAVEMDPLAALIARGNLVAAGMSGRARVLARDFLTSEFKEIAGRTLYVGNPPYVRHHQINSRWKLWLKAETAGFGSKVSSLAGLHAYFFLAIARGAKPGDFGCLITGAEWLDVNYGQLIRDLLVERLGVNRIVVFDPKSETFPGTQITSAVTTFAIGSAHSRVHFLRAKDVSSVGATSGGIPVSRNSMASEQRWSKFTRPNSRIPSGFTELGELCRVHRGQVTGANQIWIHGEHSAGLPSEVLFPSVTRATELFDAGLQLSDDGHLKRVIDIPIDLEVLCEASQLAIAEFLKRASKLGAKKSYTARHRRAWWSVGLRESAPILATYMARRPPAFVLNSVGARHLNVAHGLYPREPMELEILAALVRYLCGSTSLNFGRVYAGGLTKFEPGEMEKIPVPTPEALMEFVN